jgi:hypothetical protein
MGLILMPTANVRYGRPKGSGLDDSQQLQSIAALLAANPQLKPTTAIRFLGVDDPSTIRRLRDKFRVSQSSLMAHAHRAARSKNGLHKPANTNTQLNEPHVVPLTVVAEPSLPPAVKAPQPAVSPAAAFVGGWCDVGFAAMSTIAVTQALAVQYWLTLPAVSAALRAQLTVNSVAIAVATRKKRRPHVCLK